MGVKAPLGIERFYYVAYPVGLIVAFGVYYLLALVKPPLAMERGAGWKEPKDYLDEFDAVRYGDAIDTVGVTVVEESEVISEGKK